MGGLPIIHHRKSETVSLQLIELPASSYPTEGTQRADLISEMLLFEPLNGVLLSNLK